MVVNNKTAISEFPLWKGEEKEVKIFLHVYFFDYEYSYFLKEFSKMSSVIQHLCLSRFFVHLCQGSGVTMLSPSREELRMWLPSYLRFPECS